MQNTILLLIEQIAGALGTEFSIYLPHIIPMVLRVFMHDTSHDRIVTGKVGYLKFGYIFVFTQMFYFKVHTKTGEFLFGLLQFINIVVKFTYFSSIANIFSGINKQIRCQAVVALANILIIFSTGMHIMKMYLHSILFYCMFFS